MTDPNFKRMSPDFKERFRLMIMEDKKEKEEEKQRKANIEAQRKNKNAQKRGKKKGIKDAMKIAPEPMKTILRSTLQLAK